MPKQVIKKLNKVLKKRLQKKKQNLEQFITRFGAKASKATQAKSKLKQLNKLEKLEEENINLEDSVKSFEEGVSLVKQCQKKLQDAELKIRKLLDDGSSSQINKS